MIILWWCTIDYVQINDHYVCSYVKEWTISWIYIEIIMRINNSPYLFKQDLNWWDIPPPQVREHCDHSRHSDHLSSCWNSNHSKSYYWARTCNIRKNIQNFWPGYSWFAWDWDFLYVFFIAIGMAITYFRIVGNSKQYPSAISAHRLRGWFF